jgi:hypothetical protein
MELRFELDGFSVERVGSGFELDELDFDEMKPLFESDGFKARRAGIG